MIEIICTVTPDVRGVERFPLVYDAGMTMLRIDFSQVDEDGARRLVRAARTFDKLRGRSVRILQDLRGPRIVVVRLPGGEVEIPVGQPVRFCSPEADCSRHRGLVVPVVMDAPFSSLESARRIATADGSLTFDVVERCTSEGWIDTSTRQAGTLRVDRPLRAPGMLAVRSLTDKDRSDINLGLELKADVVCLAGAAGPEIVKEARRIVGRKRMEVWARIETAEGIAAAGAIVKAADGIVIGRGGLAAETSLVEMPGHQSRLARLARKAGKKCIVASGILESLRWSASPTHAEIRDIAASLREGADGFLLGSETSVGRNPALAVQVLREAAGMPVNP